MNFINGQDGICKPLEDCPAAEDDLRFSIFIQHCPTNTSEIKKVCCLEEKIYGRNEMLRILDTPDECLSLHPVNRYPEKPLKQGQKAWKMCLKYQNEALFPCGIHWHHRELEDYMQYDIVSDITRLDFCSYYHGHEDKTLGGGGVDAKRREFPHMALLGYGKNFSEAEFNCGGSLISDRFLLTAAHCTYATGLGNVSFAVLGTYNRETKPQEKYIYLVKTILKHPMYKPPKKYHDIALLEMNRRVTFDSLVIPACLHVGDEVEDSRVYGTGWGILGNNKKRPKLLQNIPLWKVPQDTCSLKFSPYKRHLPDGIVAASQMCYGDDGTPRDTCEGDSGGPLQIESNDIHCMYIILGVTSFGITACGEVGYPGVYTRVSNYVPWIESIVWP
ncbi:serine protease persephone-like isoform X2 [Trichoplusia ni]|uniref:Serine protease persephone-like isoform X2 n=1 Tax=Trichoplusia ni TaxID=7111 RepID=A0A7E5WV71_TRINI|nr:serine protease persephone-like isoform X2 [Trichoplusia ni]